MCIRDSLKNDVEEIKKKGARLIEDMAINSPTDELNCSGDVNASKSIASPPSGGTGCPKTKGDAKTHPISNRSNRFMRVGCPIRVLIYRS